MLPAVPEPDGDTAFVGSVTVSFPTLASALRGRIYYTLDGTDPTQFSHEYLRPFEIKATTTLKSVRIVNGVPSAVHQAQFTRKRLPPPLITYPGKPEFTGTKQVTLSPNFTVPGEAPNAAKPPIIRYTLEGGVPGIQYTAPFNVTKTCVLLAETTHPDYDNSPFASASFTLLKQVEAPVLDPGSTSFNTRTLTVKFTSKTQGAWFKYALGATSNPDTAGISEHPSVTLVGNTPGEVITLRVMAGSFNMAASNVTEGKYTWKPSVAPPTADRAAGPFQDTLTVALSSTTVGAAIHYTVDGSTPTADSRRYNDTTRIRLDSTTTLRAIAVKANQASSDILTVPYTLKLSAPVPSIPSTEFQDSIRLVLRTKSPTADILYTLNGEDPTEESPHYKRGDTISLSKDTTVLRVMAIRGVTKSPVDSFVYVKTKVIKTTVAPTVEPAGPEFVDTTRVYPSVSDPDATIYYSLNGGTRSAYLGNGNGIPLNANTTLRMVAHKPGLDSSAEVVKHYVLIPSPPIATPPATEPFRNRVEVRLSTRTVGAEIWIMQGRQNFEMRLAEKYDSGEVKIFDRNTYLQAVATVGSGVNQRVSAVMFEDYIVYAGATGDSLPPGQERSLSQGMALVNKGTAPITAKLGSIEQQDLKGFKDPTHSVTLSAGPGQAAPKAVITRPAGQRQAVYLMVDGRPEYVGSGASVEITRSGTYFAAVDTLPPSLALASATPKYNEGTQVKLRVIDNVSSLSCVVKGSGIAAGGVALKPGSDGLLSFTVKNGPDEIKDLWFKATARDSVNSASFPASGAPYCLVQAWSKLTTPPVWTLGVEQQPYDLAGFPIGSDVPLTWGQIKRDNPDPALTAYVYKGGGYQILQDADVVEPGLAFWLGSRNSRSSLALSKFHTPSSPPDGLFRIHLKKDWNLITNPSLGTLYWPSARSDKDYAQKPVRGLWGYDGVTEKDYVPSDSLLPWKGYWVLNQTGADTLVELLTAPRPSAQPAMKRAAEPDPLTTVEILLDHGRSFPLRLGARTFAGDGVGVEDEPLLPFWNRTRQGWSARDRERLMTDVLRFAPGQVMRWKLVLEGVPAEGRDSLVTVAGIRLPPGFEAWAWSARRNLKLRLQAGAGYSLPGAAPETLLVMAGPASKLAALPELAQAVERVDAFRSAPRMGKGGPGLHLALPTDAWVKAELLSYSGRIQARIQDGRLGSGHHFLAFPEAGQAREAALLRVSVRGQGWREYRVHKIVR